MSKLNIITYQLKFDICQSINQSNLAILWIFFYVLIIL